MIEVINSKVKDYLEEKYQPVNAAMGSFRAMGERDMVPIILRETESILSVLLDMKKPKKILEIGTAIGYSASFFALTCPDAEIHTIEKEEASYRAACENVQKAGVGDRVHLYCGDGEEQIRAMAEAGVTSFDFIFIDAAKSHYQRFLDSALAVAEDGAIICSDNIMMHGMTVLPERDPKDKHRTNIRKMRDYLDFITGDPSLVTTLLPSGDGLAISVYHKK